MVNRRINRFSMLIVKRLMQLVLKLLQLGQKVATIPGTTSRDAL